MKLTKEDELYKNFKKLMEARERTSTAKNSEERKYLREEYLRMDREFFEQMKHSEIAKEIGWLVAEELYDLYFSEKKSKE